MEHCYVMDWKWWTRLVQTESTLHILTESTFVLHTISDGPHITAITIAMYDTHQPSVAHTNLS